MLTGKVFAADHVDGPRASADPAADITDVYAWTSPDASRLNLVMDLVRNASTASRFSDSVEYVFHTSSSASFGAAAVPADIVCSFYGTKQKIHCRMSDHEGKPLQVQGDASSLDGIQSADGKLKVFAGLRNDPFFFNLAGFKETASIVANAAAGLLAAGLIDSAGCPALDATTSALLVNQLKTGVGGSAPVDSFANFNVLSIVLSIDKSVLTKGGPIVGVWASTNRRSNGDRIGVQIDRMGRPGVNTALTNPFFLPSELESHEAIVDAYNAAANPANWVSLFAPEIAGNLAIFDGINLVCGDQLLADQGTPPGTPPGTPAPGRYNTLASVLADDRLFVNSASGSCAQYLAVEANYLGISNNDCGGRTPLEDVIDTTYSVLALPAGTLSGVDDGVPVDGDGGEASLTQFPFLDAPNN